MTKKEQKIKALVAKLYRAAGCGCCRDTDTWYEAANDLGKLLGVPEYDDGSGYAWYDVPTALEMEKQP